MGTKMIDVTITHQGANAPGTTAGVFQVYDRAGAGIGLGARKYTVEGGKSLSLSLFPLFSVCPQI